MINLEADFDPSQLGFLETDDIQEMALGNDEDWMMAYTTIINGNKVYIVLVKHRYLDQIHWKFIVGDWHYYEIESGATLKEFVEGVIMELEQYQDTTYHEYFKATYRKIKLENILI